MIILKSIITILIFLLGILCFLNVKKWSLKLQGYFIGQANKVLGSAWGWDKPWGLFVCKLMIIILGSILLISAYPLVFGTVYIG